MGTSVADLYSEMSVFARTAANSDGLKPRSGKIRSHTMITEAVSCASTTTPFPALDSRPSSGKMLSSLLLMLCMCRIVAYNPGTLWRNGGAFVAVKSDGSAIPWGFYGGTAPSGGLTNVKTIYSTDAAFAAVMNDGSVVAWGDHGKGSEAPSGLSGVTALYSTQSAFAAVNGDGTVVGTDHSSASIEEKEEDEGDFYYMWMMQLLLLIVQFP